MPQHRFGTPEQQALLRRGEALYRLLADDASLTYYGRGVGTIEPDTASLARLRDLVALQGMSNIFHAPNDALADLRALLEAEGYSLTHYAKWVGGAQAIASAEAILAEHGYGPDITLGWIDAAGAEALPRLAEISLANGVLPITGAVMTGALRPGCGLVALDGAGRPVSCAAAAAFAHPAHPSFGRQAWWGMLATDPARRGERLALLLGAEVLLRLHRRHGFDSFFTGVQPGNAASEAVCAKMGLTPTDHGILTVVDPAAVAGGKMTK